MADPAHPGADGEKDRGRPAELLLSSRETTVWPPLAAALTALASAAGGIPGGGRGVLLSARPGPAGSSGRLLASEYRSHAIPALRQHDDRPTAARGRFCPGPDRHAGRPA